MTLSRDSSALASDQTDLAADTASVATASGKAISDRAALAAAIVANTAAQTRLRADRARLRGIAVALYTDESATLLPVDGGSLDLIQSQMDGEATVTIVVNAVVKDVASDVQTARAAGRTVAQLTTTVATDSSQLLTDRAAAAAATSGVADSVHRGDGRPVAAAPVPGGAERSGHGPAGRGGRSGRRPHGSPRPERARTVGPRL